MRAAIFLTLLLHVSSSSEAQTWTAQNSGVTSDLFAVHFASATHGWAVGRGGVILATADSGNVWTGQLSGVTSSLNDVFFVSPSLGWTVGDSSIILNTTDGGATWQQQSTTATTTYLAVYFLDSNTGYAFGSEAAFSKTTNGGATWITNTPFPAGKWVSDAFFISESEGWAVTSPGPPGHIFHTTDGGATWNAQPTPPGNPYMGSVQFTSSMRGYAVGDGVAYETFNGGQSWTTMNTGIVEVFYDVSFPNDDDGWVTIGAFVRRTRDGGATWTTEPYFDGERVLGAHFVDPGLGYTVRENGGISRYTDLSTSVDEVENGPTFSMFPNPASASVRIVTDAVNGKLTMYNCLGTKVHEAPIVTNETTIDIQGLSSGVYLIQLNGENSNASRHLVIE